MFIKYDMEVDMIQKYSSKDTSINVINKVYKQCSFHEGCTVFDYGGGKYDTNRDYMKKIYNAELYVYDKYNRSEEENHTAVMKAIENTPDYIVCSNVLNVIMEESIIDQILSYIASFHAPVVYIAIYEGDKSGTGKETKKGWQRNQKSEEYAATIKKHFHIESKYGNIFTLSPLKKNF